MGGGGESGTGEMGKRASGAGGLREKRREREEERGKESVEAGVGKRSGRGEVKTERQ